MDHDHKEAKSGGNLAVFLVALLVPIFYGLMLGPAARIHDDSPRSVQIIIETAYWPLAWLAENTPLREPIVWYVELWGP
ncbi:MAG: hypothetical protein U1E05_13930 [Patescibacteria group bacterium]|nr:hypothetical protein [Patescibacteria group bacterium]